MKNVKLLRTTGILCLLFAIGHLTFPHMPYWHSSLNAMEPDMKYIFLSLHFISIALLTGMGTILTFQTVKLLTSPICNSILLLFASLFIIRISTEIVLWRAPLPQAAIIIPLCAFPVIVFLRTMLNNNALQKVVQDQVL